MKSLMKKAVSLGLVCAMVVTLNNVNIINRQEVKADRKTVYNEIEKINLSDKCLENIAENAVKDGEKTAKQINKYEGKDFEAAVNYALTSYYKNEDTDQLDEFTKNIDKDAHAIVQDYKVAAEERNQNESKLGYEPGIVVFSVDGDIPKKEIEAVCKDQYGEVEEIYEDSFGDYLVTAEISYGQTVGRAIDKYEDYSIVEEVEENSVATPDAVVNDPYYPSQYYLNTINAPQAWDYMKSVGYEKVLVGVIDTGVDYTITDLQGVLSDKSADITGEQPIPLTDSKKPYVSSHGTFVTSLIAAKANNNSHIAGVASCYDNNVVEVLAVQAAHIDEKDNKARFYVNDEIKALDYCYSQGVKVINMSLGGYGYSAQLERTIEKITENGTIIVASAGNDTTDKLHYPSDFDRVISVVSTTSNNTISSFSNYGEEKDICAPGSSMYSCGPDNKILTGQGTSYGSPVAAAVVAMMCSVNNNLNYFDAARIMANTATELPDDNDKLDVPYGVVNAEKSVKNAKGYTKDTMFEYVVESKANVAYKKPVKVSNEYSTDYFPLSNLVDNNTSNKTIIDKSDNQWVEIDLGDVYSVSEINVWFEGNNNAAYSMKLSKDGVNWIEVAFGEKQVLYTQNIVFAETQARYVKLEYTQNTTYLLFKEIKVMANQEAGIGYRDIYTQKEKPFDPINVSARCVAPRIVNVSWKKDEIKRAKGYGYRVYVDGILHGSTIENMMLLSNLSVGKHTIKVSSVLNGFESKGVSVNVDSVNTVQTTAPTTTKASTTTTEPQTTTTASYFKECVQDKNVNLGQWNYYVGSWAGAGATYEGGDKADNFKLNVKTNGKADWGIQAYMNTIPVIQNHTYKYSITLNSSKPGAAVLLKDDANNRNLETKTLENGDTMFSGTFTASTNTFKLFLDLHMLDAGTTIAVKNYSLVDTTVQTTQVPTTEKKTSQITTTTMAQPTTTQQPTTVEQTTEETTIKTIGPKPLEVIGLSVSGTGDNQIGVVWGQDAERINSGCKYNVYVNGEIKLSNVICNYYTISEIPAGNVNVTVKATLNGVESDGVSINVNVTGEVVTTATRESTTAPTQTPTTTKEIETTTVETTTAKEVETTTEAPTTGSYTISDINIAQGKTAVASSIENDSYKASNVIDGSMDTRWSSAWTDDEWIYIDLGKEYNVAEVQFFWEGAFAADFKLQTSTDANSWTDIQTLGDTYCRDYDVKFSPVKARYIKMQGQKRGTVYGYSLFEIKVFEAIYGGNTQKPEITNISKNRQAVASSVENRELSANAAFDGNEGSRWSSAWTDNEWIYVDLGSKKYIDSVSIVWEAAFASNYMIQISDDANNWETAKTVLGCHGGTVLTEIKKEARYVKMQGMNRSTTYGYSIFEMNVFGY